MLKDLQILYNTLILIETKGESTQLMAECIKFTKQLISNEQAKQTVQNNPFEDNKGVIE